MSDFPSSKYERSKIFAKTGFKVGTNYAKHYVKESMGGRRRKKQGQNKQKLSDLHRQNAQQIFQEFSKLRGTALKIAQSMSMDQSMMPEEFGEVLAQAQYKVPPINKALVRTLIDRELGRPPEKLFSEFQSESMAAASIGQVHRAKTLEGEEVVVKIQYPNVRETIDSDLSMAKMVMKRIVGGENIDPYVKEVREKLMEETDYRHEGQQLNHFNNWLDPQYYVLPEWKEELSSDRIITMTYVEGKHLDAFLNEQPDQEQRNHFGQLLWDFFHHQIDQTGPIHADTHPGNFLFREDGRLGILDFGCTKSFPEDFFYHYLKLLPVHLRNNDQELRQLYEELEIYQPNHSNQKREEAFFEFSRRFGNTYAEPYRNEYFDFGDPEYRKQVRQLTENAPMMLEARGSKHFIYSTRVHLGLYNFLMKLGAHVQTGPSRERVYALLDRKSSAA